MRKASCVAQQCGIQMGNAAYLGILFLVKLLMMASFETKRKLFVLKFLSIIVKLHFIDLSSKYENS